MKTTHPLTWIVDGAMCNMMNFVQWRRRTDACSKDKLAAYISACSPLSREEFFGMQPALRPSLRSELIEWDTPRPSGHLENDRARVRFYPARNHGAPTVFLLHALMSASDVGYRRLAERFNTAGWSVAFPHLPYHYSRTPARTWNGELAITADLVRNAEGLRQAVIELRQLMALLRTQGTKEFALIGTSYGGWIGALLAMLEEDFRDRILPFDRSAARAYAAIAAERRAAGRPISQFDCQIAAIARARAASVATRNTDDYDGCGIEVIDPWGTGGS